MPYKNSPDVVAALKAKDVQVVFEILPPLLPQIKSGWMKALAVTGEQRFPGLPNVPTAIESGLKEYKVTRGTAFPHRPVRRRPSSSG